MNVQCPACGTYVAETATMCPYCGFRGDDPSRPIYKQGEYHPVPIVPCEIVVDDGRSCEIRLSDEDNKNLFRHLTDWKWLSTMIPALAETLESIFGGTVHLEAKLPEHIMHMIEEGKLHFATDKNGEILAEVFDERNKIFKQVRLEKVVRNDALLPAMQHLETQAALCLVMEKIDEVGRAVQQLGEELQQDRLARIDAALDMFQQACRIKSSRERNEYVREALNEATHAKALLVRNFAQQQRLMEQGGKKSDAALRAMQDYVAIVNAVNVQMQTHMALGQQDAAAYCLQDLNKFIKNYDLDKRDTMLNLVGSVKSKNRGDNPEKFVAGSLRIAANVENVAKALDAGEAISPKLITESERNGNDSNDEEKQHDEED
jgi:organic radical activating enzyme